MIAISAALLFGLAGQADQQPLPREAPPTLSFSDPASCQPTAEHEAFLKSLSRQVDDRKFMIDEHNVANGARPRTPLEVEFTETAISFTALLSQQLYGLDLVGAGVTYWNGGDPPHYTWRFKAPLGEVRSKLLAAGFRATDEENLLQEGAYNLYLWLSSDVEDASHTLLTCGHQ